MSKLTIQRTIDTKDGYKEVTLTPRKAIRYRCLDCCCFDTTEVRECAAYDCPLWSYRMGRGAPEVPPDV